MCNAWNHAIGCNCGWGGEGHLGRRTSFEAPTHGRESGAARYGSYDSYVNPNAKCPVCGAAVFFYQSSEGGRVFFDELGPPWPKHPCTDNGSSRTPASSKQTPQSVPRGRPYFVATDGTKLLLPPRYGWALEGWQPLLLDVIASETPTLLRLSGTANGQDWTMYVLKREFPGPSDPQDVVKRSLVHVRRIAEGRFKLALFMPSLRPIEVFGYASSIDASNAAEKKRASRSR